MTSQKPFKLVLIGGGAHANVISETMRICGLDLCAIVDKNTYLAEKLGISAWTERQLLTQSPEIVKLIIGIGNPTTRCSTYEGFQARGFNFISIVHPSSVIAPSVEISDGAQVMAGAVVQPGVKVGRGVLVNTRAVVDHDCKIGDFTHIAPGAIICGGVTVGTQTHIGAGSCVLQQRIVGDKCIVGAGAVVTKNVPDCTIAVGIPAQFSRK